jgi:hypothetical protein
MNFVTSMARSHRFEGGEQVAAFADVDRGVPGPAETVRACRDGDAVPHVLAVHVASQLDGDAAAVIRYGGLPGANASICAPARGPRAACN